MARRASLVLVAEPFDFVDNDFEVRSSTGSADVTVNGVTYAPRAGRCIVVLHSEGQPMQRVVEISGNSTLQQLAKGLSAVSLHEFASLLPGSESPEKRSSSGQLLAPSPVCAVSFTLILLAEPIEKARLKRTVEASQAIEVGMTPEDVRDLLGEPNVEYRERGFLAWLLMGYRPRQWMYGTLFNLDYLILPNLPFPNPFPINIRIAEYAEQDLVIDWSREDVVTAIRRPDFKVPPFADDMLDAVNYVKDLYRLLSANPN